MSEIDEIMEKMSKTLMCRTYHQTYELLVNHIESGKVIDPEICEFGNHEDHKEFFRPCQK